MIAFPDTYNTKKDKFVGINYGMVEIDLEIGELKL